MSVITKQLALGNLKVFNKDKLPTPPVADDSRYVSHMAYTQRVYNCEHDGKKFTVVMILARMGIGEINMEIEDTQFPSKAALIRFYRAIKQLTIEEI